MKILLINAPPQAGKDTAAQAIIAQYHGKGYAVLLERFSMPLKRAFAGVMNLPVTPEGHVEPWERGKDQNVGILNCSYRQWQIDFSERHMKPLYGDDIFARLLLARLPKAPDDDTIIVIPDCGFQVEADVLLSRFDPDKVFLLTIAREGCKWDSRSRVKVSEDTPSRNVENDEDLITFQAKVIRSTRSWITRP